MTQESLFLQTMGDTPVLRVLDFLVVHDDFDYSMTEIARLAGVGYATLKLFWKKLEAQGVVVLTRRVGRAKLYRLNEGHVVVKKFKAFYWATVKEHVPRKKVAVTVKKA